jgi:branched-chain amino acid aminotransferase
MHRDNPRAKLTQFIATAAAYRAQLEAGVNEMLMIGEDGSILEGLSSNFFGVVGGVLRSANEGVLNGITRSVVLDLAKAAGIPVELRGVRYQDWPTLDECFITSASRGVLPVIQIDEHVIAPLRGRRSAGPGQPGPITRRLVQEFTAWVQKELDEI